MVRTWRDEVLTGLVQRVVVAIGLVAAMPVWVACAGTRGRAAETTQSEPVRERNCTFETLAGDPGPGYVEIARIDLEGEADFGAGKYRNTRAFATRLREMVCELGGDAVKTDVDAYGVAWRATVFQRVRTP